MAISVTWPSGIIHVPKADTTLEGTDPTSGREIRSFDLHQFHHDLRVLEESDPGRPFPITHDFDPSANLEGVNYAPRLTIRGGYYKVEFEDGQYRVLLLNANSNVLTYAVVNQVSISPTNSAGLIGIAQLTELLSTTKVAADNATQANLKL